MPEHQPHPLRIQRKRTKGFRLPPGAVCVTRPGKWGNPFRTAEAFEYALGLAMVGKTFLSIKNPGQQKMFQIATDIEQLRGKLVACWCPLDKPCHADSLAREANK